MYYGEFRELVLTTNARSLRGRIAVGLLLVPMVSFFLSYAIALMDAQGKADAFSWQMVLFSWPIFMSALGIAAFLHSGDTRRALRARSILEQGNLIPQYKRVLERCEELDREWREIECTREAASESRPLSFRFLIADEVKNAIERAAEAAKVVVENRRRFLQSDFVRKLERTFGENVDLLPWLRWEPVPPTEDPEEFEIRLVPQPAKQ